MHALTLVIAGLLVFALAYRYYVKFIITKILVFNDKNPTPAHTFKDGRDYHPTNRYVLFGHYFAAISGAGPLVGPVLAAQFGYLPGFLWILIGTVLAGAVHDMVILFASGRTKGLSLTRLARKNVGKVAGVATGIAILFIIITALAGLALVVVNALNESSWAIFTIVLTILAAFLMAFYMYKLRPGKIFEASLVGVVIVVAGVVLGETLSGRAGGAVSLAAGMSVILSAIPGMKQLVGYWYHFAIMFEALFILTTVDAGTRVGRYIVQDLAKLARPGWRGGNKLYSILISGGLISFLWGYLVYNGDISTIWPMFGVANQLLATLALSVGTVYILKKTKRWQFGLVTFLPSLFMFATTVAAGILNIKDNYLPKHTSQGNLNAVLSIIMMLLVLVIFHESPKKIYGMRHQLVKR